MAFYSESIYKSYSIKVRPHSGEPEHQEPKTQERHCKAVPVCMIPDLSRRLMEMNEKLYKYTRHNFQNYSFPFNYTIIQMGFSLYKLFSDFQKKIQQI